MCHYYTYYFSYSESEGSGPNWNLSTVRSNGFFFPQLGNLHTMAIKLQYSCIVVVLFAIAIQSGRSQDDTEDDIEVDPSAPEECREWATFENNEEKTRLWELCNARAYENIKSWIESNPCVVHARSEDGRGALFWA